MSVDKSTHKIQSRDVSYFRKATYADVVEHLKTNNYYSIKDAVIVETPVYSEKNEDVFDDDPMPADWKIEEVIEF